MRPESRHRRNNKSSTERVPNLNEFADVVALRDNLGGL
jgi:hypothetical protein